MIEFASLFLGFVLGVRPVELVADPRVAAVELRLDGRQVARISKPPWKAEVDFGDRLEPRRLEALAFDARGIVLERAQILVNTSRSDYGASLALETFDVEGRRPGRVLWAAVLDQNPVRVDLRFDDEPLAMAPDGRFFVPPYDGDESHFLTAELTFRDGHVARAELSFGGRFGDRVTSALTAVPVRSPPGRPWTRQEVQGWFEHDGKPVEVFAARAGEGQLLVVRSERTEKPLRRLRRQLGDVWGLTGDPRAPERPFELTMVLPRPLKAHRQTFELLRLTTVRSRVELGRRLLLDRTFKGREKHHGKEHLWDAVALAGRHAAASERPRAVVLLLGDDVDDHSDLSLEQAVHYLESVGVPLFVWAPEAAPIQDYALGVTDRLYHGVAGLDAVIGAVVEEIVSQTIVWLEGEYLLGELALDETTARDVGIVR